MTQQTPQSRGQAARPGQMTAVMRAVAVSGPKVLRIGVVQGGRVVEERIIKQRTHVTIGASEKNTFVVTAAGVPSSFRLFELVADDYALNFLDSMSGRAALASGVADLAALRGQAPRNQQGAYQVKLTDEARGKVVVGDTTFLFQFVAPPPVQPKAQLPVSVTRGTSSIDWATTVIAGLSFLVHFSLIGSIYSDWLDAPYDYDLDISKLVEQVRNLPAPPPVEEPVEVDKSATSTEPSKEAPKAASAGQSKMAAGGKMTQAQAAALSNQMQELEMATLGALAALGPATADVLRSGEVPTGALDQSAASAAGVGASGGFNLGNAGGGALRVGAAGGGLGGLAQGKGEGGGNTGAAQKVAGPKGTASVGGANVQGGQVSDASRVVAGMRAGFRACYNRALATNPDAEGKIMLSIRVGPGGEVTGVSASQSGSLPASVVSCVQGRASAARFQPPTGGAAVVQVPVSFVKQ